MMSGKQITDMPTQEETSLGQMEYDAVVSTVQRNVKKKRQNCKFTDEERYLIGKYTSIHGPTAAVRKFKRSHPHLKFGESTARSLKSKYEELSKSKEHNQLLPKMQRGRPLMLGSLDEKVRNFLMTLRRKGGVVNAVVAIATARALIEKSQDEHLKCIDLNSTNWTQSLFRRMGFVKRMCTTSKPEIPDRAVKEAKLLFQHQIASLVEEHAIPPSLIMNFDQTPLKYAPVYSNSLAKKGSKHVAIAGGSFKEAITATFGATYANKFLPMQLIYKGKTQKSFPRVDFPTSFSLSANEKHFSNTQESLKLLDEIIMPYVEKERDMLQLAHDQPALLIIDVFSGQMTKPVIDKINDNYIKLVKIPPNMTHIFQPLDLTVNGAAKAYMKKRFTEWYSACIVQELDNGKDVESISIQLKMSVLKPLQAQWIIDLFDYFTSEKGREIISNGWKAAFITEAISSGTSGLEPLDPFSSVDPLSDESESREVVIPANDDVDPFFVSPKYIEDDADGDGEWVALDDGERLNNIFDILDDM